MSSFQKAAVTALLMIWLAGQAVAGNVFALPANTFDTSVTVLSDSTFQNVTTLTVPPGVRGIFARPDGSKYYVVSGSSSDTVLVMNSTLTSVLGRKDLGVEARAAGLSPDGRRLLVLAGGKLHVFDTTRANDDEITTEAGLSVGGNPTELAFALDSSTALILSPDTGELFLYNLATSAVGGSADLGSSARSVSVAPNGLFYVTATNVIYEIDPSEGTVRREIRVNGAPNKGAFTPDGKYGIFPNAPAFAVTGLAFLVDMETRQVSVLARTGSNPEVALDQVIPLDNTTFLGVSTSTRSLARVTVNPLAVARTGFLMADKDDVRGLAGSGELPQVRYLYVGNGASISRGNTATSQVEDRGLPASAGRVVLGGAASTNAPTGGYYRFNDRQSVTAGSTTQPLILRVWDTGGASVFGKNVEFTSQTEGVEFAPATTKTSADGYALTTVTVPDVSGVITVEATVEGRSTPITFEITVVGGGGGTGGAGLKIHSGNGQVVPRGFPTERPLMIRLTTAAGAPISGSPVIWAVASGEGIVFPDETETDAEGIAQTTFVGTNIISPATSYIQSTVTASVEGFEPASFVMTTVPLVLGTGAPAKPIYTLLAPESGTNLTGRAGQTQPGAVRLSVKALTGTMSGTGIPNVGVELSTGPDPATNPSASCAGEGGVALTDATGTVTCDVVFGPVVGGPVPIVIIAGGGGDGSAGAEYNRNLTVSVGPPTLFTKISGDGQTGGPGTTLQPFVAEISDGVGHVLPGTVVTWESLTPNTVTVVSSVNTADSRGRVSATVQLGSISGAGQVRVRAGSAETVFNVTVSVPIATLAKISGDNQSATLNRPFTNPLVVEVRNAQGQPIQGAAVSFTLVSGPATLGSASGTTDANGRASTTVTAGATAGAVVVRATAGQFTATFNLSVSLPISSLTKISGDGQTAVVNQDFAAPLVVEVSDGQGAPVSGAAVTFSVVSGSATIVTGTAASGANGRASTAVRAGAASGPVVIQAASFTFTTTFNLFVIPPGPVISRTNILSAISGELGVTPGGIVAIYGQGIAPDLKGTAVANSGNLIGPLPTSLAGVEVLFGSTNAPIYHVNNINGLEWIVVQAPFSLTAGQPVAVTVKVGGGSTTIDGVEVKPYQPAIFETLGPAGQRWAVITKEDGSYVSADNPIRKGIDRRVRLYCAGLGQSNPALLTNGVGVPGQALLAQASLYILTTDGTAARVVSAEPMVGVVGIYVLTVELPVNLVTGTDKVMVLGLAGSNGAFTYNVTSSVPRVE